MTTQPYRYPFALFLDGESHGLDPDVSRDEATPQDYAADRSHRVTFFSGHTTRVVITETTRVGTVTTTTTMSLSSRAMNELVAEWSRCRAYEKEQADAMFASLKSKAG